MRGPRQFDGDAPPQGGGDHRGVRAGGGSGEQPVEQLRRRLDQQHPLQRLGDGAAGLDVAGDIRIVGPGGVADGGARGRRRASRGPGRRRRWSRRSPGPRRGRPAPRRRRRTRRGRTPGRARTSGRVSAASRSPATSVSASGPAASLSKASGAAPDTPSACGSGCARSGRSVSRAEASATASCRRSRGPASPRRAGRAAAAPRPGRRSGRRRAARPPRGRLRRRRHRAPDIGARGSPEGRAALYAGPRGRQLSRSPRPPSLLRVAPNATSRTRGGHGRSPQ